MAAVIFASKLKDDGSFTMPREAVAELGLHPGDEVQVRVEATNGAGHGESPDQEELQRRVERFYEKLDSLTFEKPTKLPSGDEVEIGLGEIMDEKFHKLGFK